MGYKEVFDSLKEVFPQIDIRMLKAVAIEHHKDADAAVEFIISEVLPHLDGPLESCCYTSNFSDSSSFKDSNRITYASHEAEFSDQGSSSRELPNDASGAIFMGQRLEQSEKNSSTDSSLMEHVIAAEVLDTSMVFNSVSIEEPNMHAADGTDDTFHAKAPCLDETVIPESFPALDESFKNSSDLYLGCGSPFLDENEDKAMDSALSSSEQSLQKSDIGDVFANFQQPQPPPGVMEPEITKQGVPVNIKKCGHECEGSCTCHLKCDAGLLDFNHDMENLSGDFYPSTIATRSGQVVSIDVLEDFFKDANNSKNKLLYEIEIVRNLVEEVECYEKEALQAKYDALKAGVDVLSDAEELKKRVADAKETNNMHAGELYGEKSILATEARGLQSRLLNLANETDECRSTANEISKILEARLAAAKAEKAAAEEEKLKKEEKAHKALEEQTSAMEEVAQESKKILQEAEENYKLKKYLMEQGHMVDELQGKIAVVSEDIASLKVKIEGHVPLSESIDHSTMADPVLENVESSGGVGAMSSKEVSETTPDKHDDDWVLFDGSGQLHT